MLDEVLLDGAPTHRHRYIHLIFSISPISFIVYNIKHEDNPLCRHAAPRHGLGKQWPWQRFDSRVMVSGSQ